MTTVLKQYVYPALQQGCVGAWGASAADQSRASLRLQNRYGPETGALTNMNPTRSWVPVEGMPALTFDPTAGTHVSLGHIQRLNTANISISTWARRTPGATTPGYVMSKRENTTNGELTIVVRDTGTGFRLAVARRLPGSLEVLSSQTFPTGKFIHVAVVMNGSTATIYEDGVVTGSGPIDPVSSYSTLGWLIGARYTTVPGVAAVWDGSLDDIRAYNRSLSPQDIAILRIRRNIAESTYSSSKVVRFGDIPTNNSYTLVADQANLTLTRRDANLVYSHRLVADQANFTLTRRDANLVYSHRLVADQANFTLTRRDANLVKTRTLVADQANLTLTRRDANLVKTRTLVADQANFTLTRRDANLSKTGSYTLTATQATFSLTRRNANLVVSKRLVADQSTYTLTRRDANLTKSGLRILVADVYSFTLTRQAANLIATKRLVADQASYTLTRNSSFRLLRLTASSRTFTVTAFGTLVVAARRLPIQQANYTLTRVDANFQRPGTNRAANYYRYMSIQGSY